jgi:hypothetical protein
MTKRGTNQREERLVRALRDNLRRRKGLPGEAAKPASKVAPASEATRTNEPKRHPE